MPNEIIFNLNDNNELVPIEHENEQKVKTKVKQKSEPKLEPKVEQNIEKLPITEIKYYNVIKKIYHISDIHIHLNFKHDEYREVFSKLYDVLKQEPKPKNSCVVITGDILHSKTELSPECIHLTVEFLQNLSNIMTVILIAGNHDANLSNPNRLDSISPIIEKFISKKNKGPAQQKLYYLKDTGIYKFKHVMFCVTSVFDYNFIPEIQVPDIKKCFKIALFHGRVNGALLYNGIKLDGELNNKLGKTITPSNFTGYDYSLLGDIHKYQFLDKKKTIAYSGSLIQQNHGENLKGHGVLVWDLYKKTTKFIEIPNNYGYYSLKVMNNIFPKDLVGENGYINRELDIPHKIRLRIEYKNTKHSRISKLISIFKKSKEVLELSTNEITSKEDEANISKISLDITDLNYQNNLIEEYLNQTSDATDIEIKGVQIINQRINQYQEIDKNINKGEWKLIELRFSNLFCYGQNNVIDFRKYKGIVGIVAPNHMGKSAILDIILYCLYDKFPRRGSIKDIVNNRSSSFKIELKFKIGNFIYCIQKNGKQNMKGFFPIKVKFFRTNQKENIKETLTEDSVSKTKKLIERYLGNYNDVVQTSFSIQNNNTNFIDTDNALRRKELEKMLKIDLLETLRESANKILRERNAVLKHLNHKCPYESLNNLNKDLQKSTILITEISSNLINNKQQIENCQNELKHYNRQIIPNLEYESANENEHIIEEKISLLEQEINDIEANIRQINDRFDGLDGLDGFGGFDGFDRKCVAKNIKLLEKYRLKEKKERLKIQKLDDQIKNQKEKLINIENMVSNCNLINCNLNLPLESQEVSTQITYLRKTKGPLVIKVNKLKKKNISVDWDQERELIYSKISALNNEVKNLSESLATESLGIFTEEYEPTNQIENVESEESELFDKLVDTISNRSVSNHSILEHQYPNDIISFKKQWTDLVNKIYDMKRCLASIDQNRLIISKREQSESEIIQLQNKLATLNNDMNTFFTRSAEINSLENQIKEIHMDITSLNNINKSMSLNVKINKKIKKMELDIEKIVNYIDTEIYPKMCEIEEQNNKYVTYQDNLSKKHILTTDLDKKQNEMTKLLKIKEQLLSNIEIMKQITDIDHRLLELKEKEKDLEQEENIAKMNITQFTTQISMNKEEIKKIQKMEKEIKIYKLYVEAMKGIPYMLILRAKPVLEDLINNMLKSLADFTIKFSIKDKKIDLYLDREKFQGRSILLSNSSGFEKFVSSLCIRVALLQITSLPKPNFIAIDEGWSNFDSKNINNIGIIFDYLKSKFDFVLTISHIQQIRQHINSQIILKTDSQGFSVIEKS